MNSLAILAWNPTIRGLLFPAIQFLFLCGSAYVIMATNIGNRLGFLVASAAFWGWMALMAIIWMIYGIGPAGAAPSWKHTEEVFTTKYAQNDKVQALGDKPGKTLAKGWHLLGEANPSRGEAQSAIDAHIGKDAANWVSIGGYQVGGGQRFKVWPKIKKNSFETPVDQRKKYKWYNPSDYAFRGLLHEKKLFVGVQQQALKEQKVVDGVKQFDDAGKPVMVNVTKAGKPVADPNGKKVYHVLTRNLGTRRLRSFRVFIFSTLLTIISLIALHYRDKKVMAAMSNMKARTA